GPAVRTTARAAPWPPRARAPPSPPEPTATAAAGAPALRTACSSRCAATGTDSPIPPRAPEPPPKSRSRDATAPRRQDKFPRGRACPASTPECAARVRDRRIAGSSFFLSQHALQFLLRFKQPCLGCPFRNFQDACDLRVPEALHFEQQKDHPV